MLQILAGSKRTASPEIVWRNPNRLSAHRRRHSLEMAAGQALYIVQEFVEAGEAGFWLTISDLEVVYGDSLALRKSRKLLVKPSVGAKSRFSESSVE